MPLSRHWRVFSCGGLAAAGSAGRGHFVALLCHLRLILSLQLWRKSFAFPKHGLHPGMSLTRRKNSYMCWLLTHVNVTKYHRKNRDELTRDKHELVVQNQYHPLSLAKKHQKDEVIQYCSAPPEAVATKQPRPEYTPTYLCI